jgi:hypothetical protein
MQPTKFMRPTYRHLWPLGLSLFFFILSEYGTIFENNLFNIK